MADDLTSDNHPLSRPKPRGARDAADRALNCTNAGLASAEADAIKCTSVPSLAIRAINCTTDLPDAVRQYVHESLSENTRRAYLSDLTHFELWGGRIPASDVLVASYLADHAERLGTATLARRLAAIAKAHTTKGLSNPIQSPLVKATIRGIMRCHRTPPHQARALLRDDLFLVLSAIGSELRDVRDRALLLIGFAGGFRRSELVGLNREDIESVSQGILVHVRRSKTDQTGIGRTIAIPFGRTQWCPVSELNDWLARSGIERGALFRWVNRHDHLLSRLTGEAVSLIIKGRVAAAGIDQAGYSGHSLRAGFVTSAAQAGLNAWEIRRQTGHASQFTLAKYVREQDLFVGNPLIALL